MYAPLHLVSVHVARAAQDDVRGCARLGALHQDELVIADPDLADLLGLAQQTRLETLLTLDVGEAGHKASLDGVDIADLDGPGGVHHHLGEEVVIGADQLAGHAGLGAVDETLLAEIVDLEGEDDEKTIQVPEKINKIKGNYLWLQLNLPT